MADRYDDELAERRAGGGRPKRERGAGGAAATTGAGGGALPLQWADPPEEAGAGADPAEEAGSDVGPDEGSGGAEVVEMGATIDLTGRAERARGDDLDVWSDVLRRRPAEAARLTGHPSAAGERIARRPGAEHPGRAAGNGRTSSPGPSSTPGRGRRPPRATSTRAATPRPRRAT